MSGMRRKSVVKTSAGLKSAATSQAVYTKLAGKSHMHACTDLDCRKVYEDNCKDPALNGRCTACRQGRRPPWEAAREPRECCVDNTQMVTSTDELLRYDLAGPGPWFQCRTCARCHARPVTSTPTPRKGMS